jgi:3-oxoacyl-[acyl-carrier protein] reductase
VTAERVGAAGGEVVLVARGRERLEGTAKVVEAAGGRAHVYPCDLTDLDAIGDMAQRVQDDLGRVDILVNNAGGSRPIPWDSPDAAWDESFSINFTAVRRTTQALLPGMIERRWGRILCVTGSAEPSGVNAAVAAKAGVHAWAKGLSREIGKHGITINCLSPGRVHSEQIDQRLHPTPESRAEFAKNIPLGYFGDPSDVAFLAAFLCSSRARYITGERIHVDGGLHRAV